MLKNNWFIFKDIEELSQELLKDTLFIAQKSIQLNGCFKIVLTGGTSIIYLYKLLCTAKSNWEKWHIYIGDERCLPLGDKDRNDHMIHEAWLSGGSIPKENIHFIRAELGVKAAASQYEGVLKNAGDFDVVLLSIGEDGHVASLFPGHSYDKNKSVVVESNSPKYPRKRIGMSYSRLNKSKNVFKIICGNSKKNAVNLWLKGKSMPINEVHGQCEKAYICKDALPDKYKSLLK
jgi:6-phosphogluconolactonase